MKKQNVPLIHVENLTLAYADNVIVRNLNFTINSGDIFVIMGMSGCGKSTVLKSIIGLLPPKSGHIFVNNIDLWSAPQDIRNNIIKTFGVSYQNGALFSSMTLYENIALPLEINKKLPESDIKQNVMEKLKLVGLEKYGDFYPSEISGGMVKRAALARAMITNPKILFFDEPGAGLDPLRAKELDDLILEISKKSGTTIVMVTHELDSIMTIATNSVYIDAITKTVLASGAPKQILTTTKNEQIVDFLTRDHTRTPGGKK